MCNRNRQVFFFSKKYGDILGISRVGSCTLYVISLNTIRVGVFPLSYKQVGMLPAFGILLTCTVLVLSKLKK